MIDLLAVFLTRVDKADQYAPGACWQWTGPIDKRGYGRFQVARALGYRSHRFAYERIVGPVPVGLMLDHLCRNRSCVNPAHLEPVTNRENVIRGVGPTAVNARKTECAKGHPYTPENTMLLKGGRRWCRTCHREARLRRIAKNPEKHRAYHRAWWHRKGKARRNAS